MEPEKLQGWKLGELRSETTGIHTERKQDHMRFHVLECVDRNVTYVGGMIAFRCKRGGRARKHVGAEAAKEVGA